MRFVMSQTKFNRLTHFNSLIFIVNEGVGLIERHSIHSIRFLAMLILQTLKATFELKVALMVYGRYRKFAGQTVSENKLLV